MFTFIVNDKHHGTLISLRCLMRRIPVPAAAKWRFRDVTVHIGRPFGLTVQEFEQLTRQSPNGYCVEDRDMRAFIDADIQVIDGEIDAIAKDGSLLVTIECEDATQWEIHTPSSELALEMEGKGFKKQGIRGNSGGGGNRGRFPYFSDFQKMGEASPISSPILRNLRGRNHNGTR